MLPNVVSCDRMTLFVHDLRHLLKAINSMVALLPLVHSCLQSPKLGCQDVVDLTTYSCLTSH